MKKVTLLSSLLVAGAVAFTGVNGTAQADEIEIDGAKTVSAEVVEQHFDIDGDGWADGGYSYDWMPQEQQDRIIEQHDKQQAGEITQAEANEIIAQVFDEEYALLNGSGDNYDRLKTDEDSLITLAQHAPKTLNYTPLKNEPYDYHFVRDSHEFNFTYDGNAWTWGYDEIENDYTDEELIDLVHNNPDALDKEPVKNGAYDFKISDDEYVYHFASDGSQWTWSYENK